MVTKKRVFVTIMVIVLIGATVSAGVVGRQGFGGYGAAAVVASDEAGVEVTRPIQRWQTLTEEELANCPLCAEGVDVEAIRAFQAERAALREDAQLGAGYGPNKSNGRNNAGAAYSNRSDVGSYGRGAAQMQNQAQQVGGRSMMSTRGAAQSGPIRGRR